jgi:plastocyanin domain-containing protein
MYMKTTIGSIIIAVLIIGGALLYAGRNSNINSDISANNVTIIDGKQIIDMTVRGGYQPRKSVAKAGVPTTIRFNTNGAYDCSTAVRIPSLSISENLKPTSITDISIGTPQAGLLRGTCAMGMYSFEIEFSS